MAAPAAAAPVVVVPATASQFEIRLRPATVNFLGRKEEWTLLIAREPRTGLTIWKPFELPENDKVERFFRADGGSPESAVVAIVPDRLVRISVVVPPLRLAVHESRETFGSLDQAERELLTASAADSAASSFRTRNVSVPLPGLYEYFVPPGTYGRQSPWISDARFENGSWRITLTGPEGNTALVKLDPDYRVVEACSRLCSERFVDELQDE